jgi:hypothetical protein
MSLARRERRRLSRIESDICRSDPTLARLLAEFGEDRPADGTDTEPPSAQAGKQTRAGSRGGAVAVALRRGARAVIRAIVAPGAQERVHRFKPQPLARTPPWQRFT